MRCSAVAGGVAAAGAAAIAKGAGGGQGNAVYGFMILGGWAALLLIGANTEVGEQLGRAGPADLIAAALLGGTTALILPWLMPRLLRARLLPQHDAANGYPVRRWQLGFDLLAAAGMAIGTASMGLMAAFALVLVPAWIAFRSAPSWRWTLAGSAALGVVGYLVSFAAALALDQPFGPMLVAVLLVLAGGYAAVARGPAA